MSKTHWRSGTALEQFHRVMAAHAARSSCSSRPPWYPPSRNRAVTPDARRPGGWDSGPRRRPACSSMRTNHKCQAAYAGQARSTSARWSRSDRDPLRPVHDGGAVAVPEMPAALRDWRPGRKRGFGKVVKICLPETVHQHVAGFQVPPIQETAQGVDLGGERCRLRHRCPEESCQSQAKRRQENKTPPGTGGGNRNRGDAFLPVRKRQPLGVSVGGSGGCAFDFVALVCPWLFNYGKQ